MFDVVSTVLYLFMYFRYNSQPQKMINEIKSFKRPQPRYTQTFAVSNFLLLVSIHPLWKVPDLPRQLNMDIKSALEKISIFQFN